MGLRALPWASLSVLSRWDGFWRAGRSLATVLCRRVGVVYVSVYVVTRLPALLSMP